MNTVGSHYVGLSPEMMFVSITYDVMFTIMTYTTNTYKQSGPGNKTYLSHASGRRGVSNMVESRELNPLLADGTQIFILPGNADFF